jgi:hypothetical protein
MCWSFLPHVIFLLLLTFFELLPKTCNFTICSIFSNSGHVGWCTASPDTILKLDTLVMNCKNVRHIKIYLPCNFEVNPIAHFGVISLFYQIFKILILFVLYWDLLQNCRVGRSWHAEHVCSLNLTFISNSFWNKGRKVLKCWKFDKKGK